MTRRTMPSFKRAVSRLIHEERNAAAIAEAYQDGEIPAECWRKQQNILIRARENYNRQLTKMATRLGEER